MNVNCITNTGAIIVALIYSYHERLLKHTIMDQPEFNKPYKFKHIIIEFTHAPPVVFTFVQSARLAAQRQSKLDQCDANKGNPLGTHDDIHQPQ